MPRPLDTLGTQPRLAIAAGTAFTAGAGVMAAAGAPDVARFAVAALALAALAVLVGASIEQVGEHLGPGPPGCSSPAWATCPSSSWPSSPSGPG